MKFVWYVEHEYIYTSSKFNSNPTKTLGDTED